MKVLVAVKVVPMLGTVRFQTGINRIVRECEDLVVNPPDKFSLAVAQGLRKGPVNEVVLVTMGPPEIQDVVRGLLDTGVDRIVHLCDPSFAGADTLATARVLAQVCRRENPDLLLCGRGTTDGGTAQTPAQVAELLGIPHASGVVELELAVGVLRVVREVERGRELRELSLPAVVSVEPRIAHPAVCTPGRMASLEVWDAGDLGGDEAGYGIRGSRTYVQRVEDLGITRSTQLVASTEAVAIVERAYRSARAGIADFSPRSTARMPTKNAIWALAECDGDRLHPVSFEAIACAAQVAERFGAEIVSVLLCDDPGSLPYELAARGADRVLAVTAPELAGTETDARVGALCDLIADRSPLAVIAPWSSQGREYLPRVAARLELGLTGDFVGLDVGARSGDAKLLDLVWLKPAWAGTAVARVIARSVPSLGTLRPGAVRRLPVRDPGNAPVEVVPFVGDRQSSRNQLLGMVPLAGGPSDPVDMALVVLCVGSRVDHGTVRRLEELAGGLPWAVAGTVGAVDAGLVPAQRELSTMKRSIAPPVFVGLDLDGPADLACVRSAGVIIVICSDSIDVFGEQVDAAVTEPVEGFVDVLASAMEGWREVGARS